MLVDQSCGLVLLIEASDQDDMDYREINREGERWINACDQEGERWINACDQEGERWV